MWQFKFTQLIKRENQYAMANFKNRFKIFQQQVYCVTIFIMLLLPNIINANISNATLLITEAQYNAKGSKYTIDDLLNTKFTYKVSDDIDMDPCKASM